MSLLDGIRDLEHARADPDRLARYLAWKTDPADWVAPELISTTEVAVDGPHGPVWVRVYRPSATDAVPLPGLLWVHGGGFVMGDLDMNEAHMTSAEVAARAAAVVVSADYRLAVGGVRYPVPFDDVTAAWKWMTTHTAELAVDPALLSIGGASAGGNLATAVAMRMRDTGGPLPRSMVLAYPSVHFPVPALEPETLEEMRVIPQILRFSGSYHWE